MELNSKSYLSSMIKHESINWVEWLVLTGFIVYFLFFLFHACICLVYPNDLDNEEGFILNQIHQLRTGHTIYPSLQDYPYTVGNYPPVFPLLCVPFSFLFGDIHFIGRLISILSTLILGYLIYRITYQLTEDRYSAILSGLFPFSVHYIYRWAVYNRVDMLALLFSFWGLYLIFRQSKSFWVAILLFLLGIYTKPVMIAAPITAFLYLWVNNRRKSGIFIFWFLTGSVFLFLFLQLMTHGQFYRHIILYNANPFHWGDVWNYVTNLFRFYWIFLLLVALSIFIYIPLSGKQTFSVYFILSSVVALSCGKEGSAVNYLIELILAGSILFGIAVHFLRKNVYYAQWVIPILLLLQIYSIRHIPYTQYWYGTTPQSRDFEIARSVERIVDKTEGDILSDDASLLVRTHKSVLFQPFIMSTLAKQGQWDQKNFIEDILQKRYSLVILYFPITEETPGDGERYTSEMLESLKKNYQLTDHRPPYYIHKPVRELFLE